MARAKKLKYSDPYKVGSMQEIEASMYGNTSTMTKLSRAYYANFNVEKMNENVSMTQNPLNVVKNTLPANSPVVLGTFQIRDHTKEWLATPRLVNHTLPSKNLYGPIPLPIPKMYPTNTVAQAN
jgi:hypothetical protein